MENVDTLNLSLDQLRGLFSLLMEGKPHHVVGQAAKSVSGTEMDVLPGTIPKETAAHAGNDGELDLNVSMGSSLGDPAAEKYSARDLLEKAEKCKKSNRAQQIFRVSKLWFSAAYMRQFSLSTFLNAPQ